MGETQRASGRSSKEAPRVPTSADIEDEMKKAFRNPEEEPNLFTEENKWRKGAKIPCNECKELYEPRDLIESDREQHKYYSKKEQEWCNGKTCAQCTHELRLDEAGDPEWAPTLED